MTKSLARTIEHWERLARCETPEDFERENWGTAACPLCALYFDDRCKGCPVSERSGQICCTGTPFIDADFAMTSFVLGVLDLDETRKYINEELDFLRSLL